MDIYSVSILVSILVYIAVGNYAGRRVKDLDDYFVAGRRAPTVMTPPIKLRDLRLQDDGLRAKLAEPRDRQHTQLRAGDCRRPG